jgi:hypothetical protein
MSAVQRSKGGSSTAAAAYRAGAKIVDAATGEVHDYTRKQGVLHTQLMLPGGQQVDRGEFWSGVELHHKRGDAVTARELRVALPAELDGPQRNALAERIGQHLVEHYGVAADVCVHAPDRGGDDRNYHAHILMSACSVSTDGTLGRKVPELDPIHCARHKITNAADHLRPLWERMYNNALADIGVDRRVDHRSHAARGLDTEPTIHLGSAASDMERKAKAQAEAAGVEYQPVTDRGRHNHAVQQRNASVVSITSRLDAVERELREAQLRRALFAQPASQLQQRLAACRDVAEYRQQDPQYAMLLRQYREAQRVAGCSREYLGMCRDDLAQYEREHPVVTRFASAGLRKPEPEYARLLQAVREAEAQQEADQGAVDTLKAEGKRLGEDIQEHWHASEPERLEEAARIESVLADPEYQRLEAERAERLRAEAQQARGVQAEPAPEPVREPEPDDDQRQRRVAALADAMRGERRAVNLDELAETEQTRGPRTGNGPKL